MHHQNVSCCFQSVYTYPTRLCRRQTYTVHTDSVWSLLSPDDSFSVIYSAGRDRALYRTYTHR